MQKGIKKGLVAAVPLFVLAWVATRWPGIELWLLFGALIGYMHPRCKGGSSAEVAS